MSEQKPRILFLPSKVLSKETNLYRIPKGFEEKNELYKQSIEACGGKYDNIR